jgi:hypothetical protein
MSYVQATAKDIRDYLPALDAKGSKAFAMLQNVLVLSNAPDGTGLDGLSDAQIQQALAAPRSVRGDNVTPAPPADRTVTRQVSHSIRRRTTSPPPGRDRDRDDHRAPNTVEVPSAGAPSTPAHDIVRPGVVTAVDSTAGASANTGVPPGQHSHRFTEQECELLRDKKVYGWRAFYNLTGMPMKWSAKTFEAMAEVCRALQRIVAVVDPRASKNSRNTKQVWVVKAADSLTEPYWDLHRL